MLPARGGCPPHAQAENVGLQTRTAQPDPTIPGDPHFGPRPAPARLQRSEVFPQRHEVAVFPAALFVTTLAGRHVAVPNGDARALVNASPASLAWVTSR